MRLAFQTAQAQRAAQAKSVTLRLLLADVFPIVRSTKDAEFAVCHEAQGRLGRESTSAAGSSRHGSAGGGTHALWRTSAAMPASIWPSHGGIMLRRIV